MKLIEIQIHFGVVNEPKLHDTVENTSEINCNHSSVDDKMDSFERHRRQQRQNFPSSTNLRQDFYSSSRDYDPFLERHLDRLTLLHGKQYFVVFFPSFYS